MQVHQWTGWAEVIRRGHQFTVDTWKVGCSLKDLGKQSRTVGGLTTWKIRIFPINSKTSFQDSTFGEQPHMLPYSLPRGSRTSAHFMEPGDYRKPGRKRELWRRREESCFKMSVIFSKSIYIHLKLPFLWENSSVVVLNVSNFCWKRNGTLAK